jgi:hypothetical protein
MEGSASRIAGIQMDLSWDDSCATADMIAGGAFACKSSPDAHRNVQTGQPHGLPSTLRALMFSITDPNPIPDGDLFCCSFTLATAPSRQCCDVAISGARGSTAMGKAVLDIVVRGGSLCSTRPIGSAEPPLAQPPALAPAISLPAAVPVEQAPAAAAPAPAAAGKAAPAAAAAAAPAAPVEAVPPSQQVVPGEPSSPRGGAPAAPAVTPTAPRPAVAPVTPTAKSRTPAAKPTPTARQSKTASPVASATAHSTTAAAPTPTPQGN